MTGWTPESADHNTKALNRLLGLWEKEDRRRQPKTTGRQAILDRAKAYIQKEPPAISGQNGHGRCYHVVAILYEGFSLEPAEILDVIQDWNATCVPPWSEKELRHKVKSVADKKGPRGGLLNGVMPHTTNGHLPEAKPEVFPEPIPATKLEHTSGVEKWLWHGYLAPGSITLLSSLWKAGKTTLLTHMLKNLETGGQFCGQQVISGSVLYITEESEARWADRRDLFNLTDNVEFLIRPFRCKPSWDHWLEFIAYLESLYQRRRVDLLIMDTLSNLWPVKDENDAACVQSALMPLHRVVKHAAAMLVHHNRKSDGHEATAARGSGALMAFVDTIVELRRYSQTDRHDRRRVLTGYGRYDETPEEQVVELTQGGYVSHGDRNSILRTDLAEIILTLLPADPPGLTADELLIAWPGPKPGAYPLRQTLKDGTEAMRWGREGAGIRGQPFTYWRGPRVP